MASAALFPSVVAADPPQESYDDDDVAFLLSYLSATRLTFMSVDLEESHRGNRSLRDASPSVCARVHAGSAEGLNLNCGGNGGRGKQERRRRRDAPVQLERGRRPAVTKPQPPRASCDPGSKSAHKKTYRTTRLRSSHIKTHTCRAPRAYRGTLS